MALEVYRPGQGVHARIGSGVALLLLAVFSAVQFYHLLPEGRTFPLIGLQAPVMVLWAAGLFVSEAAVLVYFLAGPDVGGAWLRKKARRFIDLLIDTQLELQKVVWPTRDDMMNSTMVVLVAIVLLGMFVFCVDLLVSRFMVAIGALPAGG